MSKGVKKIDPEYLEIFGSIYGHHCFHMIKELSIYNEIKDYTFFCIIRDPIDMLVSEYNYTLSCKESHHLYNQIKDKLLSEVFDLIVKENKELNLTYIKYNNCFYDEINNPINKNIILLNFHNISSELKNFLITNRIPEDIISKIDFFEKINESIKFIENDNIILNDILNKSSHIFNIIEINKNLMNSKFKV